jgi:hypothetical protein
LLGFILMLAGMLATQWDVIVKANKMVSPQDTE